MVISFLSSSRTLQRLSHDPYCRHWPFGKVKVGFSGVPLAGVCRVRTHRTRAKPLAVPQRYVHVTKVAFSIPAKRQQKAHCANAAVRIHGANITPITISSVHTI